MRSVFTSAIMAALLVGLASFSVKGADVAADPVASETSAEVKGDIKRDDVLSNRIQTDLRADPLFEGMRINVDLYRGLAIVHGSTPTSEAVSIINEKLRRLKGVDAVFNYMVMPDEADLTPTVSMTYDDFRRIDRVGNNNNAFIVAERVKDRLQADARLATYDIQVDTYMGLVILHGRVGDASEARRAKEIAAYGEGVNAVLSYIDVSAPDVARVTAAPVLVRSAIIETIPARYETLERRIEYVERTISDCRSCD
jgi:osmotically-inducible protein OsmY